jgi:hypothetical protein
MGFSGMGCRALGVSGDYVNAFGHAVTYYFYDCFNV